MTDEAIWPLLYHLKFIFPIHGGLI